MTFEFVVFSKFRFLISTLKFCIFSPLLGIPVIYLKFDHKFEQFRFYSH